MSQRPAVRPIPLLLGVALVALAAAFSLQRIRSGDYWWHLASGRWIVENRSIPTADPFSYTVAGAPWIDPHWLFQIGLFGVQAAGGHAAVCWSKLVAVLALLALVGASDYRRERPLVTALALALLLLVACDRIMPRPELASFLLLAGQMALLERHRRTGGRSVFAVPLLQVVWANTQGLFVLGIGLCALQLVGEGAALALRAPSASSTRVRRLALVLLLVVVASLVTPNGVDGVVYAFGLARYSHDVLGGAVIAEFASPFDPVVGSNALGLAFFAGLAALSGAAMVLAGRRTPPGDPLTWTAFLFLALSAQRNLALFGIVAATVLVRGVHGFLDARGARLRAQAPLAVLLTLALGWVVQDTVRDRFFARLGSARESGLGVMESIFPVRSTDWIEENAPPAPICHHMADGGYLIWHLWPAYRVMIDGRNDVYGESYARLRLTSPQRFVELDREYAFGTVLVHYRAVDFADELWWFRTNPEWTLVHADDAASVFVRASLSGDLGEVDLDAEELFEDLGDARGLDALRRRVSRAEFWTAMRRPERAQRVWEEIARFHPEVFAP